MNRDEGFRFEYGDKVRIEKATPDRTRTRQLIGWIGTISQTYRSSTDGTRWYAVRFDGPIPYYASPELREEWFHEDCVGRARPEPANSHATWSTT